MDNIDVSKYHLKYCKVYHEGVFLLRDMRDAGFIIHPDDFEALKKHFIKRCYF